MDCEKSLELLSDFLDGALEPNTRGLIKVHLDGCPPCAIVYDELNMLIVVAPELRDDSDIAFPDENVVWQRLELANGANS